MVKDTVDRCTNRQIEVQSPVAAEVCAAACDLAHWIANTDAFRKRL